MSANESYEQDKQILPCMVGLELEPLTAAGDTSTALMQPLTALLVAELEPPEGLQGRQTFLSQTWYLCISPDNR